MQKDAGQRHFKQGSDFADKGDYDLAITQTYYTS